MNTAFTANAPSKTPAAAHNTRVLFAAGLFVVAVTAFLLHVMLVYAPLQGMDLQRYFANDVFSRPNLLADNDAPSAAMVPSHVQSFLLKTGGGPFMLRIAALFLHVAASALVFFLLRLLLRRYDAITVPMLGGLLMAVSPVGATAMTQSDGCAVMFAVVSALGGAACFLSGRDGPMGRRIVRVLLASWFAAAAAVVQPAFIPVPILYALLDFLRVRNSTFRIDWISYGILSVTGILVSFLFHLNHIPISFQTTYAGYALFPVAILAVCRFVDVLPIPMVKRALISILVLLLCAGTVNAFMQALRYADPVSQLERAISKGGDASYRRQLALHYYYMARQHKDKGEKRALTGEALSVWPMDEGFDTATPWERLLWGNALMEVNDPHHAAIMAAPLLEQAPLSQAGHLAARLKASALDANDAADEIAALFAFSARNADLTETETLKNARALALLGDMNGAAALLAPLPEFPEDSADGVFQQQVFAVSGSAKTFQETYRKQIMKDPQSVAGYAALAESCFGSGNLLRAFYWLEMVMRRAPDTEGAWELMGTIFALQKQTDYFISQWGGLKADMPQAWARLARRSAQGGAWEGSYAYARHAENAAGLSAEEYMAVFAVENKELDRAEEWLARAVEAHPLSYFPRLFKADLAIARNAPDEARRYLDEARLLQAPESEITRRASRLKPTPDMGKPSGGSQPPVRTYIQ